MDLLLGGVGAAIGSFFPGGWMIGFSIGTTIGGIIEAGRNQPKVSQGRIDDYRVTGSNLGAAIPRAWGRARLPSNIVWATALVEAAATSSSGGKKGGAQITKYDYYGSFACLILEGDVTRIRRIWADADVIYDDRPERAGYTAAYFADYLNPDNVRFYSDGKLWDGSAFSGAQQRDSAMEADDADCPAYLGFTYIVFESLWVTKFGNRIPNISVEVETAAGVTLEDVLDDLADIADIPSASRDYSSLAGVTVRGLGLTSRRDVREEWASLGLAYFFDHVESDGIVKGVLRGGASSITIDEDHLGASTGEPAKDKVKITRTDELEIPGSIEVTYNSEAMDLQTVSQSATREYGGSVEPEQIPITPIMSENEAATIALITVHLYWLQRTKFAFQLPWRYLTVTPGDIVTLPTPIGGITVRVLEETVNLWGQVEFLAVEDDASLYDMVAVGSDVGAGTDAPEALETLGYIFETNAAFDSDSKALDPWRWGAYLAASGTGSPFPGAQFRAVGEYIQTDEHPSGIMSGGLLGVMGSQSYKSTWGEADTDLANTGSPTSAEWDEVNTVDVTLENGSLTSSTKGDVLATLANMAILGKEIFHFVEAQALGGNQYRLSTLLRGQRGTEWAQDAHAIGDKFLLLGTNDRFLKGLYPLVGYEFDYRVENPQKYYDTPPASSPFTMNGYALKPYAPVHFQVESGALGVSDVVFSWVRRARHDAELMDGSDVPLDEPFESYILYVYDGVTQKRQIVAETTTATYTLAMQAEDFGVIPDPVTFYIQQIGAKMPGYLTSLEL